MDEEFVIEDLENYDSKFELPDGITVRCFSKKQMQEQTNEKSVNIIGEFAKEDLNTLREKTDSKVGDLQLISNKGIKLSLQRYKSHNRFSYSEEYYVKCTTGDYVVLLKNITANRVLFMLAGIAACVSLFFVGSNFLNKNTISDKSRLSEGTQNLSQSSNTSTDPGVLIPVFSEVNISPPDSRNVSFSILGKTSEIDSKIRNPMDKNYNCIVKIFLSNEIEPIYTSNLIAPGEASDDTITLSKPLEKGTYKNVTFLYEYYPIGVDVDSRVLAYSAKMITVVTVT
ncbi:MAG: hypothetical protein LBT82_04150 [Oscillospiraceae bacterium]|jgi:hypothetical protein|nr:hypothetical protein [Oscillospiraceae bacterium]